MQLIITDVTEMQQGNYCVGGWDPAGARMIRPLPNNSNWTAALLNANNVVGGAIIDVAPVPLPVTGAYPHRTEDTPIDPAQTQHVGSYSAWFAPGAPIVAQDMQAAFAGQVRWNGVWNGCYQGVHVLVGAQIGSLAGLQLDRSDVSFVEEFNKLRAVVSDGTETYKVAVSSRVLKEAWRAGGLAGVASSLPTKGRLHVRVGLARAFGNPPDKCYVMLNGVYW